MSAISDIKETDLIITHNKEEWNRLLFLLQDPEPNVFWINCDTAWLKNPVHNAITQQFPQLTPYDIFVNEHTESLTKIILWEDKDKIPHNAIIHIFGMENAVKNTEFLDNVNFQRNSFFKEAPGHIIFWADFDTGTVMARRTYDFWSWVVFTFDFTTPDELLTSRQKGFPGKLQLEDVEIKLPSKEHAERIRHLKHEWDEFLVSVNGKPSTIKQMKDAVTIAMALAKEYSEDGEHVRAIEILEYLLSVDAELITIYNKIGILNSLAISYEYLENDKKAEELLELSLALHEKTFAQNHETSALLTNFANICRKKGEFSKAKSLIERALKIDYSVFGKDHPHIAVVQGTLGTIYMSLGEFEEAKNMFESALRIFIKNFGESHQYVSIAMSNLASAYQDLGQFDIAKKLMDRAVNSDIVNFGDMHPNVAVRYNNIAHVLLAMNDKMQAKVYIQKAYEIFKNSLGEDNIKTQNSLSFLQSLEKQ